MDNEDCELLSAKFLSVAFGISGLLVSAAFGQGTHSAQLVAGNDPPGLIFYSGTSNPPGPYSVNTAGASPGYLNNVSGGASGTADGDFVIGTFPTGAVEVAAFAITVSDASGLPHSLSSLGDPALTTIVVDLNAGAQGFLMFSVYSFADTPSAFSAQKSLLSNGEAAAGRPQFDILVIGSPIDPSQPDPPWWGIGLSSEIGNVNGITSLSVTDIGAIAAPEPSTLAVAGILSIGGVLRRRRNFSS